MFIQIDEHTSINLSSVDEIVISGVEMRFFQKEDLEPTIKVFKSNAEARAFMTNLVEWTRKEDEDAEEFLY